MTGLRERLRCDLERAGLAPLHRYGQNFMVDGGVLDEVVASADLAPGARVVEIGPGTGLLTERLVAAGAEVLAVEIDRGLAGLVRQRFAGAAVTLIHDDALCGKNRLHAAIEAWAAAGPWYLVANLPYDIALPVILNAAVLPAPPQRIVATVQYEAGRRLASQPGTATWGASAAVCQATGTVRLLRRLGPQCFHPRPRVDSALLLWEPRDTIAPGFAVWCRRIFAARRKVVPRALRDTGLDRDTARQICAACGIDLTSRLEELDVTCLRRLFECCGDG